MKENNTAISRCQLVTVNSVPMDKKLLRNFVDKVGSSLADKKKVPSIIAISIVISGLVQSTRFTQRRIHVTRTVIQIIGNLDERVNRGLYAA
jgi:hypothetical protein